MSDRAPVVRARLEIKNRLGLHARAAAQVVQALTGFDAVISINKDEQTVDAKSILGLMMLAAGQGSIIEVVAEGSDADAALAAITALVEANFNEQA
ncbi:MAG: HPr family phosphocarrier protein [Candidatus Binatia bacterium]